MEKHSLKDPLSENELRLKAVIETAIDGIITIDTKGQVESINKAAADLFGYEAGAVIGQNIKMLMPEPDKSAHDGYLKNYLESRQARIIGIGREVLGLKKNGITFPLRLAVSEVRLPNRTIFTGIIHDLTEVKKAQADIERLTLELEKKVVERTNELNKTVNKLLSTNKQLDDEVKERKIIEQELRISLEKEKELNEMKSRFVSMASHQFRTPLSSILSSTELIAAYKSEDNKQSKRDKHSTRILQAVKHLNDILDDFLSLSKIEEGKVELQPTDFILKDFCEEVIDTTEGLLKEGQKIHHQINHPDYKVFLDKKYLKDVLYNLLSNAIKYSPHNSNIYCESKVDEKRHYLNLKIRDEGIGIPEEDQKHLFTRFFRAHNSDNIKGTGLGLHIAKRYIELLGGSITFKSKLGQGSTFIISIPLQKTL